MAEVGLGRAAAQLWMGSYGSCGPGAPWADRNPSFQTCHRRFQQWVRSRVMTSIMTALANKLAARRAIDVREAFIDASFVPAKKGALRSGRPKRCATLFSCLRMSTCL